MLEGKTIAVVVPRDGEAEPQQPPRRRLLALELPAVIHPIAVGHRHRPRHRRADVLDEGLERTIAWYRQEAGAARS